MFQIPTINELKSPARIYPSPMIPCISMELSNKLPATLKVDSCNQFNLLDNEILIYIADYLNPCDVYGFSRICRSFYRPMNDLNCTQLIGHHLMYNTLWSSLDYILQTKHLTTNPKNNVLKLYEEMTKTETIAKDSTAICGSTMTQAIERQPIQESDLDCYTTYASAAAFRTLLIELGLIYVSYCPLYDYTKLGLNMGEHIHHVEHYSRMPPENQEFVFSNEDDGEINWQFHKALIYDKKPRYIRINKEKYFLKTLKNVPFPYDHRLYQSGSTKAKRGVIVDLVVVNERQEIGSVINNFDMDICSASFNGRSFHIPNPRYAFYKKIQLTNVDRNQFLNAYFHLLLKETNRPLIDILRQVYSTQMRLPHYEYDKTSSALILFSQDFKRQFSKTNDKFWVRVFYETVISNVIAQMNSIGFAIPNKEKHSPIYLHNNILLNCFSRIKKYLRRGYTFVNLQDMPHELTRHLK